MTSYRKPLNVVLALWIISILFSFASPFFEKDSEQLQDAKNLKAQVESLKSNLHTKKSTQDVSEADYSKLNDEISVIDNKVASIIESEQGTSGWNWYFDLIAPLCSLVVAAAALQIINKPNKLCQGNPLGAP